MIQFTTFSPSLSLFPTTQLGPVADATASFSSFLLSFSHGSLLLILLGIIWAQKAFFVALFPDSSTFPLHPLPLRHPQNVTVADEKLRAIFSSLNFIVGHLNEVFRTAKK